MQVADCMDVLRLIGSFDYEVWYGLYAIKKFWLWARSKEGEEYRKKVVGGRIVDGGNICYKQHGKAHRMGEPAYIWKSGLREWYFYGLRHRDDGPAMVYSDGECE